MESLGDALQKRISQRGLSSAISATLILEAARRVLPPNVVPHTFRDKTLNVTLTSASDAYFFKQECENYLELINAALPKPVVESIRVRIKH